MTHTKFSKLFCGGAIAFAFAFSTSTVSSPVHADTISDLKSKGKVTVALAHEPPYTDYQGSGDVGGAAPALLMAALKRLGVSEIDPKVLDWGAMIPSLQAKRVDVISTGLYIKPKRCKAILFSEPDLCTSEGFAVKKGNPKNLGSMADLAKDESVTFGVCGGCSAEKRALELGVPRSRILTVPDHQNGLKMLQDGRIDVYAAPDLALTSAVGKMGATDAIDVVSPLKGEAIKCSGVGFHKDAADLRDAFDAILKDMKASGEFDKIVAPYGFDPKLAKIASRKDLCGG